MTNVICARIIIFGRSLGGAVAVDLATRYFINLKFTPGKKISIQVSLKISIVTKGRRTRTRLLQCCLKTPSHQSQTLRLGSPEISPDK